jgi:pseudouridine-5'-monophosphatase
MDGLLLNTEDIYTLCADNILTKYGRPRLPWSIKAQLMGVPCSSTGDAFHNWAQLPISREQFEREQSDEQQLHFPECKPLPGAQKLLSDLENAHNTNGKQIEIALASSSEKYNYDRKASLPETKKLLNKFREDRRVLGDDPRVQHGRGKPAPDIYLLVLQTINSTEDRPRRMPGFRG